MNARTARPGDEDVLAALQECIALQSPTPPGDAQPVAGWVQQWAERMGAHVSRQSVWDGADNVLAALRFGDGPRLVFNSHMDVVDPSTQVWQTEPYRAVRRDCRIIGRGTPDAKGSLVAMLAAMQRLADRPGELAGELLLTAVVAEEAGGLGSKHLAEQGLSADAAVVGEPTGLRVAHAHKGTYMRRLTFTGQAAHSASPWLGRNAVADAAAFVMATERETARLAGHPHPTLGPGTLTATIFRGGRLQNTVPAEAEVLVDRRLVPGETHQQCDLELADLLAGLADRRPGLRVSEPEVVVAPVPSETALSQPVVHAALRAVAGVGRPLPAAVGFNAGCDMSKLVGVGIPTVICGPGELAQAHGPDEYVEIQQVLDAVDVYEAIARDLLARGRG
jgi:acetylornithine deacetylase/succinyl-diaminopimelate desuccinylase family protein